LACFVGYKKRAAPEEEAEAAAAELVLYCTHSFRQNSEILEEKKGKR